MLDANINGDMLASDVDRSNPRNRTYHHLSWHNSANQAEGRDAVWRAKKLAYYEEFIGAGSGIVGDVAPPDAKIRFAAAVNNLHLIASNTVLTALHAYCDEIAESNTQRSNQRHHALWSRLVWEIRSDLDNPPTSQPTAFKAILWASGVPADIKRRELGNNDAAS